MDTFSDVQIKYINDIAHKNAFFDYQINATGATGKGEGYMAIINFITIKDNKSSQKLDFAVKGCHRNKQIREQLQLQTIYAREIYIYQHIFPLFHEFQISHNIKDTFVSIPKCYGVIEEELNETVIMENICSREFKLWDRKLPMDWNHIELILKEYAKLHASSLALSILRPDTYRDLLNKLPENYHDMDHMHSLKPLFSSAIKKAYVALESHPAKTLVKQIEDKYAVFHNLMMVKRKNDFVVVHGDCWSNNMMFRYSNTHEDVNKPIEACLIDWQISRMTSPAVDLSYFILINSPKHILEEFDELIDIYYNQLSKNLIEFGCNPNTLFPMKLLWEHIRTYSVAGILATLCYMEYNIMDEKDLPDFTDIVASGEEVISAYATGAVNSSIVDEFNKRLSDVIIFLYEKDLIDFSSIDEIANN